MEKDSNNFRDFAQNITDIDTDIYSFLTIFDNELESYDHEPNYFKTQTSLSSFLLA